MRASAGSSLVAVAMDLPSFSLTVTALMRVFVLAGCCGSSDGVAACCCSDVRCCFGWLPSVMLSSSCLLDEKAPPGLLAGAMDGDMTLSEVGVFGSGDGISVVVFCFFDADASVCVGRKCCSIAVVVSSVMPSCFCSSL